MIWSRGYVSNCDGLPTNSQMHRWLRFGRPSRATHVISPSCAPVHCLPQKVRILVFYTRSAWSTEGIAEKTLQSMIGMAYEYTHEAMRHSQIDLKIDVHRVMQVSAGVDEQARPHGT